MPAASTETLAEFYSRVDVAPLLLEFAADAGGDPDQYGADDNSVEALLASGLGQALKIFTQKAAEFGLITDPAVVAATGEDDVDWDIVSQVAERTLAQGFFG